MLPLLVAIDGLIALGRFPLNHDAGWLLVASSRMLDGAELYGPSLIEINPPLIIWLLLPVSWLAERLPLSDIALFRIVVFVMAVSVALLAGKLFDRIGIDLNFPPRTLLTSLLLVILAWLPGYDFGQREHLFLMGSLLWVGYFAGSEHLKQPARASEIILLTALSLSLAIKPHFLIPFLVVQLRLLMKRGLSDRLRDVSLLVVGVTFVGYLVLILAAHPRYFGEIVPMAMAHYDAYSYAWREMLQAGHLGLLVLTAALAFASRDRTGTGVILELAWYWGAGCYLMFVIQGKGWSYHLLPFIGMQVFIVGLVLISWLCDWYARRDTNKARAGITGMAVVAAFAIALFASFRIKSYLQPLPSDILSGVCSGSCGNTLQLFRKYSDVSSVYYFSTRVSDPFPAVNYAGADWASRYPTLWLIPKIARTTSDEMLQASLALDLQKAVTRDLEKYRPTVVVVDTRKDKTYLGGVEFDYLEFFRGYEGFRNLWSDYALTESLRDRDVYTLIK